jgi:hypothetical protein
MLLRPQHTRPKTNGGKTPKKRALSAMAGPIWASEGGKRYYGPVSQGRIGPDQVEHRFEGQPAAPPEEGGWSEDDRRSGSMAGHKIAKTTPCKVE